MSKPAERQIRIFGFEVSVPAGLDEGGHNETVAPPTTKDRFMFESEELEGIIVTKTEEDFIEVDCGSTNKKFGDHVGKLRIYRDGKLKTSCLCYPGCDAKNISPIEFERHAGITGPSRWKNRIWVFVNGVKKSLDKTPLLKYYKGSSSDPSSNRKPPSPRFHKDEYITCTACGKNRRFPCRTKPIYWLYHQAFLVRDTWTCSDFPHNDSDCDMKDERTTKSINTGCPRNSSCKGCTKCVCFGCSMCRFEDCSCRTCLDFILNADPKTASSYKRLRIK